MSYTIKQWQAEERPREKMLAQGCGSLTAAELIAVLIRSGSATRTAVDTARDILALADNNLTTLSRMSCEALQGVPGVGEAKALAVIAAAELGRRIAIESSTVLPSITSSAQAAAIAIPMLKGLLMNSVRLIGISLQNLSDEYSHQLTFADIGGIREKWLLYRWKKAIWNLQRKYTINLSYEGTEKTQEEHLYDIISRMRQKTSTR